MTFPFLVLPSLRLTTTPRPVRPDHAKQETVAFGDVTVEDSRNLTVNNSRKILRLAQCQVEYLLHVQETLVSHKERLRRCAEEAQRECIDAKSRLKHERVRAKELKRELRTARKALRTYEVLEQIRSGKPLEEILTGAIVFAGPDGEGSIAPGPGHSVRMSTQTMDASVLPTLAALASKATPSGDGGDGGGGGERPDSPDVMAAKAAARAMERLAAEKDFERQAASAVEAANAARAEKEAAERARAEAVEALREANETAERSLRDQADAFERTMLSMEEQLRRAQTAAEEARARAETEIADARRERETFAAESRAREQRETSAMRAEIDALKLSLGDSNSSDALVQSASALAAAKAALAATEQRLADQEAHDAETIADLRVRLNEKQRELDEARTRLKTLEEQLVSVAVAAAHPPSVIGTPHGTPHGTPGPPPPRSPYGVGHATPGSTPGALVERDLRVDSPLSARRRHDFGSDLGSGLEDRASVHVDPALTRDLEEARREFAKAKAAKDEAKAAKEDLERLRVELRDERIKAAKEEVERLRASNDALSREAEEERTRAVAAKAAELEARERAVRDAEERSEKVRAAAEALEAAELRRRLAEEEAARLRKTTPEREKGSDIAFAELRVLAETLSHARAGADGESGGARRSGGVDDGERLDAAPVVAAASSEPDAPGARERVATRDAEVAKEPTVVPAAPPPVTQAAAAAAGGERLVQEETKRREEEVFTGTIVKPFAGAIVRHAREDENVVRGDDMEGEMIVKEDVEHRPPPVTLGPSGASAAPSVRRVPSHPRMNPAAPGLAAPKPPSPGASPTARLGPRHASPAGGAPRSPRWDAAAAAVAARSASPSSRTSSSPPGSGSGSNPAVTPGSSRYYRERVGIAGPGVTTPPSGGSSGDRIPRSPPSSNPRRAMGAGSPDSVDISRAMRTDPNLNPGARDDDDSRQFSVSDISGDVSVGKSP